MLVHVMSGLFLLGCQVDYATVASVCSKFGYGSTVKEALRRELDHMQAERSRGCRDAMLILPQHSLVLLRLFKNPPWGNKSKASSLSTVLSLADGRMFFLVPEKRLYKSTGGKTIAMLEEVARDVESKLHVVVDRNKLEICVVGKSLPASEITKQGFKNRMKRIDWVVQKLSGKESEKTEVIIID